MLWHDGEHFHLLAKDMNGTTCGELDEIVPIQPESSIEKRPIGLAKGEFSVPESFYDELPEELVQSFYPY
jgi:hypothetical protein